MKTIYSLVAVSFLVLTGCSTMHQTRGAKVETVMITYHVRTGKEADFQALLAHAWQVYRSEQMVFAKPHIVVKDSENGGKTKFVEIFTWVKSPDQAPETVQAVWKQEQSMCETRNGHTGIEGGEVQLISAR
jgi:hypothetical protein